MCPLIFSHNSNPLYDTVNGMSTVIDHYSTVGPATAPTEGPGLLTDLMKTDPMPVNMDFELDKETKM